MAEPLSEADFVKQTIAALRKDLAKHAPHALELQNAYRDARKTQVDMLLDALVREAPEIAEQWRMSEFDATDDLEMTPDEVAQSQSLLAAIARRCVRVNAAFGLTGWV